MKLFPHLFLFFWSAHALAGNNDSTNGIWNVQARADYGFIIAHRPALEPLQEAHVKGFEISVARSSDGSKEWQHSFNFPDYGITAAYFDLGSETHLGKGVVVYPFIDFPLSNGPQHGLHFRYGMGLGYVEKIFNSHDNYKNSAIGSHINGVIHFDLHYEHLLLKRTSIEVGAGITHYSNGSVSMPNLGINIATANLSLHHSFGKNAALNRGPVTPIDKSSQIHVYVGGFYKKIYPPLGEKFFAFTLSAMHFKPFTQNSAWGFGADIFHDNSISERIERQEEKDATAINDFRFGVHGAYHLTVGKLGLMFNMGFYLYNAFKDDGNVYQRICTRYYFKRMFLCANLKSHYARADFIELGVGYRFLKKSK